MKKIIMLILFLFIVCSAINAEIKQILDNFPPIPMVESFRARNIHGTFEFVNLPEPLKVTTINFTLEIAEFPPSASEWDWTLRLPISDNNIKMLSDSLVIWKGPHKVGDIFTGTIEFIPLSSGLHGLTLSVIEIMNDFSIEWVFDENRNLLALDNQYVSRAYDYLNTFYFEEDSIFLNYNHPTKNRPFMYEVTIKPIPKIGDTSTVHVRLIANTDFPNGLDLELISGRVNIVSNPNYVDYPILKNQVIDLNFDIVPDSFNLRHGFHLFAYNDILNKSDHKKEYHMSINFLFNEDGSLRFVLDQAFNMDKARKYYLKTFKSPINSSQKNIKILKDKKIFYSE